jgi:hypothetical protein
MTRALLFAALMGVAVPLRAAGQIGSLGDAAQQPVGGDGDVALGVRREARGEGAVGAGRCGQEREREQQRSQDRENAPPPVPSQVRQAYMRIPFGRKRVPWGERRLGVNDVLA